MQNLIATLLLVLAFAYLLLKWMPVGTKEKIRMYSMSRFPAMEPLFSKLVKQTTGCGSGCSNCSSPSDDSCTNSLDVKPIKLIRKTSPQR
ncbi:hypothetical protein ACO0LF_04620 [Undibacterium sp. Di27W]|uniref:hypothetical protein n=1 Tax=Undibacterium sp. Di27W TaxID=3413036 RepID=UPI003BF452C8